MRAGWTAFGAGLAGQIQALGTDPASLSHVTAIFNLPAVLIIFAATTLLVVGIKESANFNNVIVMVKVAVVLLFIAGAAKAINPANWHPLFPPTPAVWPLRLVGNWEWARASSSSPTSASTP